MQEVSASVERDSIASVGLAHAAHRFADSRCDNASAGFNSRRQTITFNTKDRSIYFLPSAKDSSRCSSKNSGSGKPKSAVGNWQRTLGKLFKIADVRGAYALKFRHTFATEALAAGVALDLVSKLLGHRSTKVTERHDSHWIQSRQEWLDRAIKMAWTRM
jgi:integrase